MPIEEDKLAAIEAARVEMETNDKARHDRYVAEDEQTAAARKREDDLYAEGVKVREGVKADVEAAIKKRDAENAVMSPAAIEELMARIALLEGSQKKAEEPAADDTSTASDKKSK